MRVCLVYDHIYPATIGGGERWMHDLALALVDAGHDVTYVTMRHWAAEPPELPGVEVIGLVPANAVYAEGRRSLGPPARFGLAVGRFLLRHGSRFDVVHTAAFPFFPMLGAAIARRRGGYSLLADWYEVWSRRYWRRYAGDGGGDRRLARPAALRQGAPPRVLHLAPHRAAAARGGLSRASRRPAGPLRGAGPAVSGSGAGAARRLRGPPREGEARAAPRPGLRGGTP